MDPDIDAIFTIAPRPCPSMARLSAWQDRNSPVTLMSITRCHWLRDISSAGAALAIPALLTARINGPNSLSASRTASASMSASMTSPGTAIAPRPASLISPQTSSRADSGMSKHATLAPAVASPRAMPRPILLAAPVTSAVCSSRRKLGRVMAAPSGR
jgi:hypothetical protein